MKLYFTNQTIDRRNAREIELKIESATGLELDNPFYDGDAKEVKCLDSTGKSNMTADEICGRDLKRIRDADGLLALMTNDRNIGSCMEIAICGHAWGKVVYVIAPVVHIRQHPWIVHFATEIFENHYEFIKWWNGKHSKKKGWLQWTKRQLNNESL